MKKIIILGFITFQAYSWQLYNTTTLNISINLGYAWVGGTFGGAIAPNIANMCSNSIHSGGGGCLNQVILSSNTNGIELSNPTKNLSLPYNQRWFGVQCYNGDIYATEVYAQPD